MVRVGELWGLEWRDIVSIDKTVDENGLYISLVTLNIRAEISKNRKNRRVVVGVVNISNDYGKTRHTHNRMITYFVQ